MVSNFAESRWALPKLSLTLKVVLGLVALAVVLYFTTRLVDNLVNSRVDQRIKVKQDEADAHKRAAEESAKREAVIQAELDQQKLKTAEAEARAAASEQALQQVRTIRVRVEGDYARVRDARPDQAVVVDQAFKVALCEQMLRLGKLPEGTRCK